MQRFLKLVGIWLVHGTTRARPRPSGLLGRLARDERGGIAIMLALLLPLLVGAVGIGVEAGLWFAQRRSLQAAVDASAMAAALEVASGSTEDTYLDAVATEAARRIVPTITADVDYPPTSGDFSGNSEAIAVSVTSTAETLFARMFLGNSVDFAVDATTRLSPSGGACILALHPAADSSLLLNGTNSMSMDCGIAVTSTSPTKALDMPGTATIDSTEICVAGGFSDGGSNTFPNADPEANCAPPPDPLASLPEPAEVNDPCTHADYVVSTDPVTISPGVYCNGIEIPIASTVTFLAGTYILAGKGLKVSGDATISGDEVFFYNTDNSGDEAFGDVDFSGNSTVRLSAPTSGTYAGVLFFNDRSPEAEAAGKKFKVAGTVATDLDGGQHITFNGTGNFNWQPTGCAGDNVTIGGTPSVRLVE